MKKYTIKNIIFGLRGEYLRFYEKVQDLDKLVVCKHPHHLYVSSNHDRGPFDVICSFTLEEQAYRSDRHKTVAGYIYDTMDEEGKRIHENDSIQISDKKLFEEKVEALNDDPFTEMSICEPITISEQYNSNKTLFVWPNLIEYRDTDRFGRISESAFYYPYEDRIFFETEDMLRKPNERLIRSVLEEEVPEQEFRRYHKELMDTYPNLDFRVDNSRKSNKTNGYDIIDNEKGLVLKR